MSDITNKELLELINSRFEEVETVVRGNSQKLDQLLPGGSVEELEDRVTVLEDEVFPEGAPRIVNA